MPIAPRNRRFPVVLVGTVFGIAIGLVLLEPLGAAPCGFMGGFGIVLGAIAGAVRGVVIDVFRTRRP